MNPTQPRKCYHCSQYFLPDPRQRDRQRFCVAPACRVASKAASQARWLARPENRDYFCGTENVQRVREWREAHPGYSKRFKRRTRAVTRDEGVTRDDEMTTFHRAKSANPARPLQETWREQSPLAVGLIAHLAGSTLQDDMVTLMRGFITRRQALLAGNRTQSGIASVEKTQGRGSAF